jgi:hypothetical protein
VNSLQDVQMLIEEIEGSHIKIPILIKHYLKMGARLIALNIDRDFGNALDILMMTDLLRADPDQMRKYLTPKGYAQYLHFHGQVTDPIPPRRRNLSHNSASRPSYVQGPGTKR